MSADTAPDVRLNLVNSVLNAMKVGTIVLDAEQRIVFWNHWMEQHTQRPADTVLGQSFASLFPDMVNGRVHAAIKGALQNNFSALISQTLNKAPFPLFTAHDIRMPQAVQVMPIQVPPLPRHCVIQITDVSMAVAREKQLREQALELQSQTLSDGLTGIPNRRRFDTHLEEEFRRAKRSGTPLSLVMIDVDYFKDYNDHYGHQQGDQSLTRIAVALSRIVGRPSDLVARYGGEEFIATLPDTGAEGALKLGEAMRAEVAALGLKHAYSAVAPHVTVSIGIATWIPQHDMLPSDLINAADRALYQAKHAGRNCVVMYSEQANTVE